MADLKREIGSAELEQHKTLNSCWFVIHGTVYDVTRFELHALKDMNVCF